MRRINKEILGRGGSTIKGSNGGRGATPILEPGCVMGGQLAAHCEGRQYPSIDEAGVFFLRGCPAHENVISWRHRVCNSRPAWLSESPPRDRSSSPQKGAYLQSRQLRTRPFASLSGDRTFAGRCRPGGIAPASLVLS